MYKKTVFIFLLILSIFVLASCDGSSDPLTEPTLSTSPPTEPDPTIIDPKTFLIDRTKTMNANILWQLKSDETENLNFIDNHLKPIDSSIEAVYQSQPIQIESFLQLVMSWNVSDLADASLTFMVSIGNGNTFSRDFIMGNWKKNYATSVSGQSDSFASVSIDTLTNKNTTNNFIKLKVIITPNGDEDVGIKNISVTTKRTNNPILYDETKLIEKELDVPPLQQLSIPVVGNSICSPTSLAMVMNYYNYRYLPNILAEYVKDRGANIYGNWTFNASFAGKDHLHSRVEFIDDFDTIVSYIHQGIPVIMSITSKSKEDLVGSIMAYPVGHLIVLTGFTKINDTWYAIVNDPAEYKDENVRRLYDVTQLINVFKNYTYIISEDRLD